MDNCQEVGNLAGSLEYLNIDKFTSGNEKDSPHAAIERACSSNLASSKINAPAASVMKKHDEDSSSSEDEDSWEDYDTMEEEEEELEEEEEELVEEEEESDSSSAEEDANEASKTRTNLMCSKRAPAESHLTNKTHGHELRSESRFTKATGSNRGQEMRKPQNIFHEKRFQVGNKEVKQGCVPGKPPREIYCTACKSGMSKHDWIQHQSGKKHCKKVEQALLFSKLAGGTAKSERPKPIIDENNYRCNFKFREKKKLPEGIVITRGQLGHNVYMCLVCNRVLPPGKGIARSHVKGKKHQSILEEFLFSGEEPKAMEKEAISFPLGPPKESISNKENLESNSTTASKSCNSESGKENKAESNNSPARVQHGGGKASEAIRKIAGHIYRCDVCKMQIVGEQNTKWHAEGKTHQQNLRLMDGGREDSKVQNNVKIRYKCDLCNSRIYNEKCWSEHMQSKRHTLAMKEKNDSLLNDNVEYIAREIKCEICNIILFGDKVTVENHLQDKKHLSYYQPPCNTSNGELPKQGTNSPYNEKFSSEGPRIQQPGVFLRNPPINLRGTAFTNPARKMQAEGANSKGQAQSNDGEAKKMPNKKRKQHNGKKHQEEKTNKIFVTGFRKGVRKTALINFFQSYGSVDSILAYEKYAIVKFSDRASVEKIIAEKQLFLDDDKLRIREWKAHFQRGATEKPITLTDEVIQMFSSKEMFEAKMKELDEASQLGKEDRQKEKALCTMLEKAFIPEYGFCEANPFGSRRTGLGFRDSDLDVYLDLDVQSDEEDFEDPAVQEGIIYTAKMILKKHPECLDVVAIPKARTPIVKFLHVPTKINCDISFKHCLSVRNTGLVRFFLSLDKRIKLMINVLKFWARKGDVSGAGRITNYALAMMAFYYLQQLEEPLLPSVHFLQSLCKNQELVAGWNSSYCHDIKLLPKITNQQSVIKLLHGFFVFFAAYNYEKHVICPLLGKSVEKELFSKGNGHKLPEEMHLYKENVLKPMSEKLKVESSMCIQDPFELCHNLTRGGGKKLVKRFKELCVLTSKLSEKLL